MTTQTSARSQRLLLTMLILAVLELGLFGLGLADFPWDFSLRPIPTTMVFFCATAWIVPILAFKWEVSQRSSAPRHVLSSLLILVYLLAFLVSFLAYAYLMGEHGT